MNDAVAAELDQAEDDQAADGHAEDDGAEAAMVALVLLLESMAADAAAQWSRALSGSIGRLIADAASAGDTFDSAALIRLRRLLRAEAAALPADLAAQLDALIADAIEATNDAMRRARGSTAYRPLDADDISDLASGEFDGRTWQQWSAHTSAGIMTAADMKLATMAATGVAVTAAINMLSALARSESKRLAMLSHSAALDVGQRAIILAAIKNGVPMVRFSAVLDGRTSEICRSLHGRVWPVGSAAIRRPPLHPYCRSTLVPLNRLHQ